MAVSVLTTAALGLLGVAVVELVLLVGMVLPFLSQVAAV
jgi:hypothetical protein